MSPIEWYYAHGNEQAGPVPSAELKELAAAGELLPDDLVWREGMDQWVTARNVKGLFEAAVPKPADTPAEAVEPLGEVAEPVSPTPGTAPAVLPVPGETALDRPRPPADGHLFDMMLGVIRAQFPAEFVESTTKIFVACGHYCLYVAMLVSFTLAVIVGVETGLVDPALRGVLSALILAVLQYVAMRFCAALDRLNRTTGGTISSTAFLDCFALLNMAAGLALLVGSAVMAIQGIRAGQSGAVSPILIGLVVFIVCEYVAFISLNPQTLSISVVPDARAGEEAVGVLSFLLKVLLRLVPVAFGAGVVYGTLWLLYACFLAFVPPEGPDQLKTFMGPEKLRGLEAAMDPASVEKTLGVWPAQVTASQATQWIICFAALPFVTYFFFLLYYLLVDLIRAVLSIPGKLDALVEEAEEEADER